VQTLYDEATEVPMFDDGCELAHKVLRYLDRPDERRAMASAAQHRAVPAYSIDARATEVTAHLRSLFAGDHDER
jgi:spore maturation protein CgeB